jgi:integrase/recombinase XerD
MSTRTVSPLRHRMIEDMSLRNLAPRTQEYYIRSCKKLAAFLRRSPDTASAEDIRLFQLHLAEQGVSICTRNRTMTGVAFLFRVTLRHPEIADQIEYIAEPQKIPVVLSPEEVRRLLDAAPSFKCRLLLSLAYGCGLRASEVVSLKVSDIDSAQMVIRIEQAKGRKDRYVMLSPELLDMLRQWWKAARPQGWLFPGRPAVNPLTTRQPLPSGRQGCRDQEGCNAAQPASFFCDPPAREQARYPDDSGSSRPQATGYDRPLHARGHRPDLQGREPTRSAGQEGQEGRAAEVARGVRAPPSSGSCGYLPQPRCRLA